MKYILISSRILACVPLIGPAWSFTQTKLSASSFRTQRNGRSSSLSMSAKDFTDLRVMVNGMPGPMATAAAEACLRRGLKLAPVAMTGPDVLPQTINVVDDDTGRSESVKLIPAGSEMLDVQLEGLKTAVGPFNIVAIDYTHPSAVNKNGEWYVKNGVPFVMGTTGGEREKLVSHCNEHTHFCVIAPNMGKQIVAMQKALEDLATSYPESFGGYQLSVVESHQKTKADTSGTAKAVVGSLIQLSGDETFDVENDIEMIRDDEESVAFGVGEEYMKGHAFHTYTLRSPDKSVEFVLKHNVSGRRVYAEGTVDGVLFLAKKMKTEREGKVYNMINVLEEGAM
jgi:4-hydroxy-tetrahydrodipicolinate reductase